MTASPRDFLEDLFGTAVAAAHPANCLAPHLPAPPQSGRLIILAAGKAAASMAAAAEHHYLDDCALPADRIAGLAVTRHGYARPLRAGAPDRGGPSGPRRRRPRGDARDPGAGGFAGPDDLVLALISGGASANWIAPAAGLSLAEKQAVTRALLRSGATITEMNTLRKHLSRIKGGRLAERAYPARLVTVAISDVPGDDPAVIGSGPTVPDPTTLADARAIVARYRLDVPEAVRRALADPANETPKPGDAVFATTSFALAARPAEVFRAVEAAVRGAGYESILLGTALEGEARDVAMTHARLARELRAAGRRAVILSGGELTVTVRGKGRGGPNQEYALALALALGGTAASRRSPPTPTAPTAVPGRPTTRRARSSTRPPSPGLPALASIRPSFLPTTIRPNSSRNLGTLLAPGPTYTNVNDFRAILVDSP